MKKTRKQIITPKSLILLLLITLTILLCASTVSANEIYVNTTGNDSWSGTADSPYLTIQKGVDSVDSNGTIHIANGQYTGVNNTNITINNNMTIIGQSQNGTIINGTNTNWIFDIQPAITVTLENLTLTNGYTTDIGGAILNQGNLTVINCTFKNNTANWYGGAIENYNEDSGSATCTITGSTFQNNTAEMGGAIENWNEGSGSATCTITGSMFKDNTADYAGAIDNYNTGIGSVNCAVTESTFENNTAIVGGTISNYNYMGSVNCAANFNRFYNNTATTSCNAIYNMGGSVDIGNNWWSSNNPDFNSLLDGISNPTYWLFMTINATPETINNTQTSNITVSFNNHISDGNTYTPLDPVNGHIPDGTPVTFSLINGPYGTLTPLTVNTTNGTASVLFTASSIGVQQINATTDDQNVTTNVTINPSSYLGITKDFRDLPWGNVITTAYYNDKIYAIVKVQNQGPDSTDSVNVLDLLDGLTWTGNYYVYRTVGSYPNTESAWVLNDPDYPFNGTNWDVGLLRTMIGSSRWLAIEVTVNQTGTVSNYAKTVNQSSYPYNEYANYTAYLTATNAPTIITVDDVRGNKGDNVSLKSVLTDYQGNPLEGETVEFWIDNVKVGENTTNSTGTALFNYIISQTPGNHNLTAIFKETTLYQGSNATGDLYVPTANLYIQITSANDNPPVGETFTVTYKLGNKGPDDANNVTVIIPIPEGFHILNIYGDGNWTVNANGTITWTFTNVTVGDPYLHLYGYTSSGGDLLFTASILSDTYNLNTIEVNSITLHATPKATPETNAATTNTVGMQTTGTPLPGMILAILMVLGGLISTRKKQ